MDRKQVSADTALLLITVIWGFTFVLVKDALLDIRAFNFIFLRFGIAFISSLAVFFRRFAKNMNLKTLIYGSIIGIVLFFAYSFQTIGLVYTSPSNSGFITGLYVVLVPLFAGFLFRQKIRRESIIGVILATLGLVLISWNPGLELNRGDVLTFFCAIAFAFHILTIDMYTKKVDSVCLAITQIGIVSLTAMAASFICEEAVIPELKLSVVWTALLITGIFATTFAYIVQNVAQKFTSPTHTALIYTAEPVFAGLATVMLTDEIFTARAVAGSILILFGMIISEIRLKKLPEFIK